MNRQLVFLFIGLGVSGCSKKGGEEADAKNGDGNQWVVDMAKVDELYGSSTTYFLGLNHSESGLPEIEGVTDNAVIWDQTAKKNPDGSAHTSDGTDFAVKDRDGNLVDPEGFVKIIPMLNDTAPIDQKHIVSELRDGDVIVYFHPEYDDTKGFMERRASHVAMHYEYTAANGLQMVHHIDNPNSYGPAYNHRPDRHMPFHVYRFQPETTKEFTSREGEEFSVNAEDAQSYGEAARKWAQITNDISPFADFFTLTLQSREDLDEFAQNAIMSEDIPDLYCSGLAYANLNLAINFPLNEQGLGDLHGSFEEGDYNFSDSDETLTASTLSAEENLKPFNELVFESYQSSDMLDAWVNVYMGHLPLEVRQGILADPNTQAGIVASLSQLEWSDSGAEEKQSSTEYAPATPENVARWAAAYGRTADDTEAYIEADEGIQQALTDLSIDPEGMTPSEVFKAIEKVLIANRFVPPRIWMDEADREGSNMVYVGTVLNCELLSAADGSDDDPCEGGGESQSTTFKEGAADTSTYAHYLVKNGEERTHRRFTIDVGPEAIGPNTSFTVRASAAQASDLMFVVHTPEDHNADSEFAEQLELPMIEFDGYCTSQHEDDKPCAPATGIAFTAEDLGLSGRIDDVTKEIKLGDFCEFEDDGIVCKGAERDDDGKYSVVDERTFQVSARGKWAITMVDMGADDSQDEIDNCDQCNRGGAHFNQWVLFVEEGDEYSSDGSDTGSSDTEDDDDDEHAGAETCEGRCSDYSESAECQCDEGCVDEEDCCEDFAATCEPEADEPDPELSCEGRCDGGFEYEAACQCDEGCTEYGNCCEDREAVCAAE